MIYKTTPDYWGPCALLGSQFPYTSFLLVRSSMKAEPLLWPFLHSLLGIRLESENHEATFASVICSPGLMRYNKKGKRTAGPNVLAYIMDSK